MMEDVTMNNILSVREGFGDRIGALEDAATVTAIGPTSNAAFCPLTSSGLQHR
jgi:hypothetical protein